MKMGEPSYAAELICQPGHSPFSSFMALVPTSISVLGLVHASEDLERAMKRISAAFLILIVAIIGGFLVHYLTDSDTAAYIVSSVGAAAGIFGPFIPLLLKQAHPQNHYTYNLVEAKDAQEIQSMLRSLPQPRETHPRTILRKLTSNVLINRKTEIHKIEMFFGESDSNLLYILGLPGVGKSTLARGALELRRPDTSAIWINCEGLEGDSFLSIVNEELNLKMHSLLSSDLSFEKKASGVLRAMSQPCILILDGFESLLDGLQSESTSRRMSSKTMSCVLNVLAVGEHTAKVLITTRFLPDWIEEGTPQVRVLRLSGLSLKNAIDLFIERSQSVDVSIDVLTSITKSRAFLSLFARLDGHPLLIEILASRLRNLPPDEVSSSLSTAFTSGNIGPSMIINDLSNADCTVLQAARIFRGVFSYEALSAVFSALGENSGNLSDVTYTLVQKAILEPVQGTTTSYYYHPLLRDSIRTDPATDAVAHGAAATWFLQRPIEPRDVSSWDDALYHLRRAAELGKSLKFFENYRIFVVHNDRQLAYAGFGRRLTNEYRVLCKLAVHSESRHEMKLALATHLANLGETDEPLEILRELCHELNVIQDQDSHSTNFEVMRMKVMRALAYVLVTTGETEEARTMAQEIADSAAIQAEIDVSEAIDYCKLHYAIARVDGDTEQERAWASEYLNIAEWWHSESGSIGSKAAMAEAHSMYALAYALELNLDGLINHTKEAIRINHEIGDIVSIAKNFFDVGVVLAVLEMQVVHRELKVQLYDLGLAWAGAYLLTAEQIYYEVGHVANSYINERIEPTIQRFLSDFKYIGAGRAVVEGVSPYYERALERRLGEKKARLMLSLALSYNHLAKRPYTSVTAISIGFLLTTVLFLGIGGVLGVIPGVLLGIPGWHRLGAVILGVLLAVGRFLSMWDKQKEAPIRLGIITRILIAGVVAFPLGTGTGISVWLFGNLTD